MKKIIIADVSLRESEQSSAAGLSFKEKLEIAKLLEKLRVDVIEMGRVSPSPADAAFLRTLASTLEYSVLSISVPLEKEGVDRVWSALSRARRPRLNLIVPASAVQMEYMYGLKPERLLEKVSELTAYCASLCPDVEFTAEDATRAEPEFLSAVVTAAVTAGARTVTLCDSLGEELPEELADFIAAVKKTVPALENVTLSVHCKDSLGLAAAAAAAATAAGAGQVKASSASGGGTLSLEQFLNIIKIRGEKLGIEVNANLTALQRTCRRLEALTGPLRASRSAFGRAVGGADDAPAAPETALGAETDILTLRGRIESLGYDVSDDDLNRIFTSFTEIARSKAVDSRDIEALVAETAGQSPAAYQLKNYVINSGTAITATSCLTVSKDGAELQAVSIGDGPIDAAFLAIEDVLGRRFELEDFQIQAVTEGREAMGDALVKLRSNGKLYAGRGLSTDIIGASVRAYLSAVNKIVYEERI